jgi:multiple sugar transport system substrate-binding protein
MYRRAVLALLPFLLAPLCETGWTADQSAPGSDADAALLAASRLKTGQPYKGQTIKVMAVNTPQFVALQKRTDAFTAATGIDVKWLFVPFKPLQEKVTSVGVAANGNVDIVNYLDQWGAAYAHWLVPLDPLVKRDGYDLTDFPAPFLQSVTHDGKLYGMPMRSNVQMFLYRKDVFDALHINPPKSWQDVIDAGPKIRAAYPDMAPLACYYGADGNRQNLFAWADFVRGAGAKILDAKGYPAWTSPPALKATRDYIALLTQHDLCGPGGTSNVEQDARISFQQGHAAMLPIWQWSYAAVTNPKDSTLKPEQVGFVPMPAYRAGDAPSTVVNTMPMSISMYSKHKDAAWEYLKWLANADLDKRNAIERNVNGYAVRNNVVNRYSSMKDPEVNAANAGIPRAEVEALSGNARPMPQVVFWPEVADIASIAINQAVTGQDVDALMIDAASRAHRVVERELR